MLDNIKYINSVGDTVTFNQSPYFIATHDLRDYEWSYLTKNEYNPVIYNFYRNMVDKTMTVYILADTKAHYNKYMNNIHEVFEYDVNAIAPGKIVVNDDYYMTCYVISKSVSEYYPGAYAIANEYSIISETGTWYKDVTKTFGLSYTANLSSDEDVDAIFYPADFPFDFAQASNANKMVSDSFIPFDFEIIFEGPCEDPTLIAGGNIYRVYTDLVEGEYLTINSRTKTVIKTESDGTTVNEFYLRDRDNYIFEKMPATDGKTRIEWTEGCVVTVTAFIERSEPKWS